MIVYLNYNRILSTKLLSRVFSKNGPIFYVKKIFGRYLHLAEYYSISCVQMTKDDIGNHILF
jgi:hypothetical protein